MTVKIKKTRRKKRRSRRVSRILLSAGLSGLAIGIALLLWSAWRRSPPLAATGGAYLLASCFVLCLRGAREHMHQIKKKRYAQ